MPSPLMIGVDVAKDTLEVAVAGASTARRELPNQNQALRTWLRSLPAGSSLAMEATGRYHQLLADLAVAAGLTVYVLNPADLRHYARAVGLRCKTDRVDAELIARYLSHEQAKLHPYVPPTSQQREIDQLLRRRAEVVKHRGALRLSLADVPSCAAQRDAALAGLDAIVVEFDRRLAQLAQSQAAEQARVRSVVGIEPLTAVALTSLFKRVPFTSADAVVAFVGLDPRAHDSGRSTGRRRLSKRGPAEVRRLLFNGARSAAKTKLWNPFYNALRQRGLSTTEATVILARKILRIAFSLYRSGAHFEPHRIRTA